MLRIIPYLPTKRKGTNLWIIPGFENGYRAHANPRAVFGSFCRCWRLESQSVIIRTENRDDESRHVLQSLIVQQHHRILALGTFHDDQAKLRIRKNRKPDWHRTVFEADVMRILRLSAPIQEVWSVSAERASPRGYAFLCHPAWGGGSTFVTAATEWRTGGSPRIAPWSTWRRHPAVPSTFLSQPQLQTGLVPALLWASPTPHQEPAPPTTTGQPLPPAGASPCFYPSLPHRPGILRTSLGAL